MLLEVLVFDGGDRVVQNLGDLLVGQQDAALQREAADHLAVVGVKFGDDVGAISFERANLGKVAVVNEQQAGGGTESDRSRAGETPARRGQSVSSRAGASVIGGSEIIEGKFYRRTKRAVRRVMRNVSIPGGLKGHFV